jgi:thioredoxin 1
VSNVTKLDASDIRRLKQEVGITVLDFYADWCGPCKALAPTLEKVAAENPAVTVGKVNVDEHSAAAMEFRLKGVPTLVFLRAGQEVGRLVGAVPRERIQDMLDGLQAKGSL